MISRAPNACVVAGFGSGSGAAVECLFALVKSLVRHVRSGNLDRRRHGQASGGTKANLVPFTKPVIPSTFLLVCSKSRPLLFISAGRVNDAHPIKGCSICSAAASIPKSASERIAVTNNTAHARPALKSSVTSTCTP